jgi:RimJ/RimL family protein N-acetyltransferase
VTQPDETVAPEPVRITRLPEGGSLVIRPIEHEDLDVVAELYAGLDEEAAYRRFFSGFHPDHEFFEHLVSVDERGGAGLVAVVEGDPDGERLVGEASYEPLANGNGELAITVDGSWRGWLGPYLLDALLEVAAAHGVPNLEADVLLTNGPMLALLRARGYAAVPTDDWSVVRAVIGAATRRAGWPAAKTGLRVLVEGAGGHWRGAEDAAAAGVEVLGCTGPAAGGPTCPAIAGKPCPLAAGADVIVVSHPADTEEWRTLRDAHPTLHPGVPICVELPHTGGEARADETPIEPDAGADVVAIVQRLARERAAHDRAEAP